MQRVSRISSTWVCAITALLVACTACLGCTVETADQAEGEYPDTAIPASSPTPTDDATDVYPDVSPSSAGPSDLDDIYSTPFETIEISTTDLEGIPKDRIITVEDLHGWLNADDADYQLIDIRPLSAFVEGSIAGARCITGGKIFELRLREVAPDIPVILIAQKTENLARAWAALDEAGYDMRRVYVVNGGIAAWAAAGYALHANPEFAC